MENSTNLQYQLRHRMQDKGLSANALEKRAGLKPSAVQNILQGKSKHPAASLLQAIANELNCSIDDIMGGTPALTESTPRKRNEHEIWNSQLYVEAIQVVEELLAKKGMQASKEKTLKYADEIYQYSVMKGISDEGVKVDHHFAAWLINR